MTVLTPSTMNIMPLIGLNFGSSNLGIKVTIKQVVHITPSTVKRRIRYAKKL